METEVNFSILGNSIQYRDINEYLTSLKGCEASSNVPCYWTVSLNIKSLFLVVYKLETMGYKCGIEPGFNRYGEVINSIDISEIKQ